jgi:hypothetical protein
VGASGCDEDSTSDEVDTTRASDGPDEQSEVPRPTQTPSTPTAVEPVVPAETETPADAAIAEPAPTPSFVGDDAAAPPAPVTDSGAVAPLEAGSQPTLAGVWPPARSGVDAGSEPASAFAHQETCFEQSECELSLVTESEAGVTYDADATRCILAAMVGSLTGSYGHSYVDRTGERVDTYFLTHPFWLAQVSTRQASDAREAGADSFAEYLCQFAQSEFLAECLAQLPEGRVTVPTLPPCANPAFWFSGCVETPVPVTPCPGGP